MHYSRVPTAFGASLHLASVAVASFDGNLNFDSPSRRHTNFGINVQLVERRSFKRSAIRWTADQLNFTHGVASGDPYSDSVILWTRVAPSMESDTSNVTVEGTAPLYNTDRDSYIEADANPICVEWKVFEAQTSQTSQCSASMTWPLCLFDKACSSCCTLFSTKSCSNTTQEQVVASGTVYTTSDIDYTVKVRHTGEGSTAGDAWLTFHRLRLLDWSHSRPITTSSRYASPTRQVSWDVRRRLPRPMTT
jgi:alkaline phosphatase D